MHGSVPNGGLGLMLGHWSCTAIAWLAFNIREREFRSISVLLVGNEQLPCCSKCACVRSFILRHLITYAAEKAGVLRTSGRRACMLLILYCHGPLEWFTGNPPILSQKQCANQYLQRVKWRMGNAAYTRYSGLIHQKSTSPTTSTTIRT